MQPPITRALPIIRKPRSIRIRRTRPDTPRRTKLSRSNSNIPTNHLPKLHHQLSIPKEHLSGREKGGGINDILGEEREQLEERIVRPAVLEQLFGAVEEEEFV